MTKKVIAFLGLTIFSLIVAPPPALPQLGNSCYMNAVVQCLLNMQELTHFLQQDTVNPTNTFVKLYKNYVNDPSKNNLQLLYKEVQREMEHEEVKNFVKWLNTTLYPIFIKNPLDSKAMVSTIQTKIKKVGAQGKLFLTRILKMYTDYETAVVAVNAKKIPPKSNLKKIPDTTTKQLQDLKNTLTTKLKIFSEGGITTFEKQFLNFIQENQTCEQQDFIDLMRVVFSNFEQDSTVFAELKRLMYSEQTTIINCSEYTTSSLGVPSGIFPLNMFDLATNTVFDTMHGILNYNILEPEIIEFNNRKDCKKTMPFFRLGDYFVFNLQRGIQRFNLKKVFVTEKLNTDVDVPFYLDMTPYHVVTDTEKSPAMYELISVAVHSGGPQSGHYVAYIKDQSDKKWYLCNDDKITSISPKKAQDSIKKGYVFFYKRVPNNDMKNIEQEKNALQAEEYVETLARALASLAS